MSEPQEPLDLQRVMALVADTVEYLLLGAPPAVAAQALDDRQHPTACELAAAGRENDDMHSGRDDPILLAAGFAPTVVPEEVVRLRRAVDEVLRIARHLVQDERS
jgi:hypothetical protein